MRDNNHRPLSHNIISLFGIILAAVGFIAGTALLVIDATSHFDNPYTGIVTYMIIPALLCTGLLLILVGVLVERRRRLHGEPDGHRLPVINLNERKQFISVTVTVFGEM